MAEGHTGRVEKLPQESVVLVATAHREADEVARKFSILESELVAAHRARDAAEEKLPSLAAKVAAADQ
jgi:hypothetical protein